MSATEQNPGREMHTIRDTVEGVWVAIVLAFVLRAFLIEAFVIPTGSMAPRLLGEHWSLQCPACGYQYDYGLGQHSGGAVGRRMQSIPAEARCPNCTYPYNHSREGRYLNSGDRVLVLKYVYNFRQPRPWDVVVFKNPQNNRENYIKRLIGLPGETIEIVHGNIFVRQPGEETFSIRRKPSKAQDATWQVIYDNDYPPDPDVMERAERDGADVRPPQWQPQAGTDRWDLSGLQGRRFSFAGGERAELRLEVPRNRFLPWYGYNSTRVMRTAAVVDEDRDVCSDLKLSVMFVPRESGARVVLETSSFDHGFRGEVDADGSVSLWHRPPGGDWSQWEQRRIDPVNLDDAVEVSLEHVDLSLKLRVGGEVVLELTDGRYPFDYEWLKARMVRADADPVPAPQVRIAAAGGASELWHVKLMRDVYYTCPPQREIPDGVAGDYARQLRRLGRNVGQGRPGWGTTGNPITLRRYDDRDLDEFMVLGDNSPQSLDSRSWTYAAPTLRLYDEDGQPQYQLGTVPRYCLTGRALLVYWPSGFRLPGLPGLPLVPNVGKMRLIR
ncbi:MAG: signal peptidase I [Phycisphaerae bacterium]